MIKCEYSGDGEARPVHCYDDDHAANFVVKLILSDGRELGDVAMCATALACFYFGNRAALAQVSTVRELPQ